MDDEDLMRQKLSPFPPFINRYLQIYPLAVATAGTTTTPSLLHLYKIHSAAEDPLISELKLGMEVLAISNCPSSYIALHLQGTKFIGCFPWTLQRKRHSSFGTTLKVFASRKPVRKQREVPKNSTSRTNEIAFDEYGSLEDRSSVDADFISVNDSLNEKLDVQSSTQTSSRNAVLQACIITSGLLFASGMAIRQVSHIASTEGWMTFDSSTVVSFDFEIWHLELITGLVVLISSCRYLLLKAWPDFAESSDAANQQVLSPLQPLDYMIVAFLPGISEELLFRGALLPLFGLSWMGALAVGAIFGSLHLGSGRKYSFAIWATFVGFAYGFATIISSSVIVPMAAHSLNNLVGGIWWRYTSNLRKK